VGALVEVSLSKLESLYGEKDAARLYSLARGIDNTEVAERKLAKSISCGKTFTGSNQLEDLSAVHGWLLELAGELEERLTIDRQDNNRTPNLLTLSIGGFPRHAPVSRSCSFRRGEAKVMADDALSLVRKWTGEVGTG